MNYEQLSKEISYALRHAPWEYKLEMDLNGFVLIHQLLSSINSLPTCLLFFINGLHYTLQNNPLK